MEVITSTQNPKIKRLLALQEKSSERRKSGLFVVEGRRELQHCVEAGYEIESVFVELKNEESRFARNEELQLPSNPDSNSHSSFFTLHSSLKNIFTVSPHVYERIAYRGSTEGVVAIVKARHLTLGDISCAALPPTGSEGVNGLTRCQAVLSDRSRTPLLRTGKVGRGALFIILESVEKPGNLGAVLRSADAAGATAVIVCDPLTDLYNPNLIRASIGACFTVPTVACSSEECIRFLKDHGVQILTAQLQDSELYYNTDMTGPTAIVMGTESTGLTEQWRQAADAHIRIPMLGRLDSLNVSVSAAILLFEAVRQREIKG